MGILTAPQAVHQLRDPKAAFDLLQDTFPDSFPETASNVEARRLHMSTRAKPLSEYRRRLKRRGVVRVEVHVRKDDAPLIRGVARALDDPARADQARALLRARFTPEKAQGLKALLAAAPLEGIDLTRDRDTGRPVDL
jgi:hypothetical protein